MDWDSLGPHLAASNEFAGRKKEKRAVFNEDELEIKAYLIVVADRRPNKRKAT